MAKAAHINQVFVLRDGIMMPLYSGGSKLTFQYDEKTMNKPEKTKKKKLKKS
tara:strand:- start:911 stop:1066 length:156 start_codon:yes stop_codon:yes gene_type:complete